MELFLPLLAVLLLGFFLLGWRLDRRRSQKVSQDSDRGDVDRSTSASRGSSGADPGQVLD